jgi:hypothetical protein
MAQTEPKTDPAFPVATLNEALYHLRRPFTPQAVRFKVQTCWGGSKAGAVVVPYIDARLASERLNLIVGENWSGAPDPRGESTWYALTLYGVTRTDVGVGQGAASIKVKAGVSDGLKRAAVLFGVGVSLYAIPRLSLFEATAGMLKPGKPGKDGRPSFVIAVKGTTSIRAQYQAWLDETGIRQFGDPIDHGDVFGSLGDADDPTLADDLAADDDTPPWDAEQACPERSESLGPCVLKWGHTTECLNADGVAWSPQQVEVDAMAAAESAEDKRVRAAALVRESATLKRAGKVDEAQLVWEEAQLLLGALG